jgi:WD40 repeat protein
MVLRHTATVRHVAFSPDGRRLASAGTDRAVKLWDVSSGQELLTLRGHSDEALAAVFSPDGRRLATSGRDGVIRIWDAPFLPRSNNPLGGRLPLGDSPGMVAEVMSTGD